MSTPSTDPTNTTPAPQPVPAPQPTGPRTTETSVPLAWAVAVVAFAAAVFNILQTGRFPSNAPVEWVFAAGVTLDLLVVTLVLLIRAVVHSKRLPAVPRPPKPSRTAIAGAALGLLGLLVVAYASAGYFGELLAGGRPQYMSGAGGAFFFAPTWVLAMVFGVAAYRRGGGTLNTVLSVGALLCGSVVAIAALIAALLYGAGVTD